MSLALNAFNSAFAISQADNASLGMQTGWNRMTALASSPAAQNAAFSGNPSALAGIAQAGKALSLRNNMDQFNYQIACAEEESAKKKQKDDTARYFSYYA